MKAKNELPGTDEIVAGVAPKIPEPEFRVSGCWFEAEKCADHQVESDEEGDKEEEK